MFFFCKSKTKQKLVPGGDQKKASKPSIHCPGPSETLGKINSEIKKSSLRESHFLNAYFLNTGGVYIAQVERVNTPKFADSANLIYK